MESYSEADAILAMAGDFGPYQWLLMVLFSLVNIASSFHYFSQTFISLAPEHWCNSTELSFLNQDSTNWNQSVVDDVRNYLGKLKDKGCFRYEYSKNVVHDFPNQPEDFDVVPCDKGWIYNKDGGFETVVSELDWVCSDDWKAAVGQSTFFAGSLIGSLALGFLSDRAGRLPALCVANAMAFFGSIVTAFSNSLSIFSVSRFISGTATDCNFVMMYIIVMEYVRPSLRTFGLNVCIGIFYCLGCVLVPILAIAFGSWRIFLGVTSIPLAIVVGYYFIVPESALWLASRGRANDAARCFANIAKFNGRKLSEEQLDSFRTRAQNLSSGTSTAPSLLGLFKTQRLRRISCILVFKSMVLTLCYDAISRNVSGLGYSPFYVFAFGSMTILPSCLVVLLLQDRIGRKATAFFSLIFTGALTMSAGAILSLGSSSLAAVGLCALARFGINVAYNSGAQYAAELIPTEVRGQGVAAVHLVGYAAAFFSSYLLYLGKISPALPSFILGPLAVICAGLCLFLPETMGRPLPNTLEDGEVFGKGEKICEFACCINPGDSVLELRPNS